MQLWSLSVLTNKWVVLFVCVLIALPVKAQSGISLTSPVPFQIFQRSDNNTGTIIISGHTTITGEYAVSASLGSLESGVLWQGSGADFGTEWAGLPVLQGDLVVTVGSESYTVPTVSIGDVYVVAGQSNAVGYGRHLQMYICTLGLRAAMFRTDGWQELADPTHSDTAPRANGSIWPVLATYMLESGVPVAFVPTAVGSSYIAQWHPGQTNFENMAALIDQLPAPYAKALLWQQGEADVKTDPAIYAERLEAMADELHDQYGIPTFAAYLYHNTNVNAGIDIAISERDYIFHGADLHDLPRDKPPHYVSDESLAAESWRWWDALDNFYPPHAS
jgi:hypothetical protein